MWYWFNVVTRKWVPCKESDKIEIEYNQYLNHTNEGQLVYHDFGTGGSVCIDFDRMTTYCSSAKCMLTHKERSYSDNHLTFRLSRV